MKRKREVGRNRGEGMIAGGGLCLGQEVLRGCEEEMGLKGSKVVSCGKGFGLVGVCIIKRREHHVCRNLEYHQQKDAPQQTSPPPQRLHPKTPPFESLPPLEPLEPLGPPVPSCPELSQQKHKQLDNVPHH